MSSVNKPDDLWSDEDEWVRLAQELGAVPPQSPPGPQAPAPADATHQPVAEEELPEAIEEVTAEGVTPSGETVAAVHDSSPDTAGSDTEASAASIALTDTAAAAADMARADACGETAGETANEAGMEPTSEPERKKRRRRRRRRRSGSATASPTSETPTAPSATDAPVTAEDETAEPEELGGVNWHEGADDDTAAETLRQMLANWNVPSWEEIVAGLYRPER